MKKVLPLFFLSFLICTQAQAVKLPELETPEVMVAQDASGDLTGQISQLRSEISQLRDPAQIMLRLEEGARLQMLQIQESEKFEAAQAGAAAEVPQWSPLLAKMQLSNGMKFHVKFDPKEYSYELINVDGTLIQGAVHKPSVSSRASIVGFGDKSIKAFTPYSMHIEGKSYTALFFTSYEDHMPVEVRPERVSNKEFNEDFIDGLNNLGITKNGEPVSVDSLPENLATSSFVVLINSETHEIELLETVTPDFERL